MSSNQENPRLIALGHNLNNVWGALLGSVELIQMSLDEHAPEQELLHTMIEVIERGEAITKQVSSIAHGEDAPPEQQPAACCCDDESTHAMPLLDASSVSLANEAVDRDHRDIEVMTLRLAQHQSKEEAIECLTTLIRRCRHHFYREEQLMRRCPDYPFTQSHHETHCALLARMRRLQKRLQHGDDPSGILEIAELLPTHIVGMDATITPYIRARPELADFDCELPEDPFLDRYFRLPDLHTAGIVRQ